jgi:nicotinic acid phosphoribosyltransferase
MSESVFADRIVQNLLDTDFYKLTMMQAVLHNYPTSKSNGSFVAVTARICARIWPRSATRSSDWPS